MQTLNSIINNNVNESGASHVSTSIDIQELLNKLYSALAEEYNAWYQYYIVTPFLYGNERTNIASEFMTHANDELNDHASKLLKRINELGGTIEKVLSPTLWNETAEHKYIQPIFADTNGNIFVQNALEQNIEAEKNAIETYSNLELFTRGKDTVTNRLIKEILGDEEEHLQDLEELLNDICLNRTV